MRDVPWQSNPGRSLIAASLLVIFASGAAAQEDCVEKLAKIEGHGRGSSASIDANFDCLLSLIAKLQAENAEMRRDLDVSPILPAEVPEGAVMAFDRSDLDEDTCPSGWEPYREARARVILGAGEPGVDGTKYAFDDKGETLRWYSLREHGGEEGVVLTTSNTPSVSKPPVGMQGERLEWSSFLIRDALLGGPYYFWSQRVETGERRIEEATFVNQITTHNNMPPYIALYFCKKKGGPGLE